MFSGGRGTESLTEAFVSHPQIDLSLLVNAYDDGLSTGRLRRFIPGLLGPSDFRKNIAFRRRVAQVQKGDFWWVGRPWVFRGGGVQKTLFEGGPFA